MEDHIPMRPARVPDNRPKPVLKWRHAFSLLAFAALLFITAAARADSPATNAPARVEISGFGFFGNRDLIRLLRNFQPSGKLPPALKAPFVEDAALVLFSRARNQGFLNARLQVDFTLTNGHKMSVLWTNSLEAELPRNFAASSAHFRMRTGVRFHYRSITFNGLHAMSPAEARSYFVSANTLIHLRSDRIFSPGHLQNSLTALQQALLRKGYRSATVTTNEVLMNEKSGAVTVKLDIHEGLPTYVRSVAVNIIRPDGHSATNGETLHPQKRYSRLLMENLAEHLKDNQYALGYPDTAVSFHEVRRETNNARIQLDMKAEVNTGSRVRVGRLIFSGNRHTRTSVIKSRLTLKPGDWLNPLEAENSRQRLAGLGVFDSVQLRYQDTNAAVRNVMYDFKETKPISLSLLAGYGSYDLLRGGLEFEDRNVFGLAHDIRLRGVQSFKSTSGEMQYTVPEVLGENLNLFVKGSGMRRREVSFLRNEYGGSIGIQKYLRPIKTDLNIRYDYQFLNASDLSTTNAGSVGATNARSAAIVIDLNRDQRVTPLLPRHGLKLFAKIELAANALGGNVTYQRVLLGGSYNLDLVDGLLLHLGLTHGVTFTLGGNASQLPFNKRFFPGGENSIRGYQEGEASPLDSSGKQLGAETYTLGHIEFEQLLTKSWSVVAFFDALGMARDRSNYPWSEGLFSVGGGLNWRTPIGPVRLEYGYNLNPRKYDPKGTLHFSIGFPF